MIEAIRADLLSIPFKQTFKHASAARASTQAIWVTVSSGGIQGCGEGCPREYVTGESVQSARAFVAAHAKNLRDEVTDVASLRDWVSVHEQEIDENPAAWTAVELAVLDLLGKISGESSESLIGLPEVKGRFRYTAVLGDAAPREFEAQLARYIQAGFRSFKIKLAGNAQRDLAKVKSLQAARITRESVRADANNLWADTDLATAAIRELQFGFSALEEPLRARDYVGMARMAEILDSKIILDESICRSQQLADLPRPPEHWIANVRVSKMGGLLRSLQFLQAARDSGVRVIVGAHVGETSLLTRAGIAVAAAAGNALVAQEGAFGTHLLEHDVIEAPLMFGAGGVLDVDALALGNSPGWGLHFLKVA